MARPRKPKPDAPRKVLGEFAGYLIRDPDIMNETKYGHDHAVAYFTLAGTDNGHGGLKLVVINAFKHMAHELWLFKMGDFIRVMGFVVETTYVKQGITYHGYSITATSLSRT